MKTIDAKAKQDLRDRVSAVLQLHARGMSLRTIARHLHTTKSEVFAILFKELHTKPESKEG